MASPALIEQARNEDWTDEQVVALVLGGDTGLYELIMRRHNQRLYRIARSVLRDDAEAEDVMQDAYVRAYQNLASFEGRAKFSTWLARIAFHEALGRVRRRSRLQSLDDPESSNGDTMNIAASSDRSPEQETYDRELSAVIEKAILSLAEEYRSVFVLRSVEGLSTEETAQCLNLTQQNVKVRLHRAHAKLRRQLYVAVGATAAQCFQFRARRCDRVVNGVFQRLGWNSLRPEEAGVV
ncbi:MAG TPA: RNA polymerase sigma factor [Candidatus Sulfotelmatobacter sp.]|nr:RNA polymerase sigma factor [Candidatus Sulfotelmatobacter sp.]